MLKEERERILRLVAEHRDGKNTAVVLESAKYGKLFVGDIIDLVSSAEREVGLMRDVAFSECAKEPRDFVTAHRAKEYAKGKWGGHIAEKLFPGEQYGAPPR